MVPPATLQVMSIADQWPRPATAVVARTRGGHAGSTIDNVRAMSSEIAFARELLARPEVIAVLHAPPLPGSARARLALQAILDHVLADAKAAAEGGAGALLARELR